jgi:hypothetical protein
MRRQATALIALLTTACYGWRVDTWARAMEQKDKQGRDLAVRVSLKSGGEIFLLGAKVIGDSVVGYNRDGRPDFVRRAVAVNDVQSMATYGYDSAKTFAAVATIGVASILLVAACFASLEGI